MRAPGVMRAGPHLLEVFRGVQAVGRGLVLGAPRDARGDVQAAREGHGEQIGVGGAPGDVAVAHLPMAQVVIQQAQRVVPPLQMEYQGTWRNCRDPNRSKQVGPLHQHRVRHVCSH